jgi:hypothetical protein
MSTTHTTDPHAATGAQIADQHAAPQKDSVHSTPNEYPFALYNHKTRQTKAAKDKDDYAKLSKLGFVEDPLPPQDPDALTAEEVKTLQALLAKAAKALEKLGQLSQQDAQATTDKAQARAGQKAPAAPAKQ